MLTNDQEGAPWPTSESFVPELEFPQGEVSRLIELAKAGRIIAVLAWADRLMLAQPQFQPIAKSIESLCKSLNMRGLLELAESLQKTQIGQHGKLTLRHGQ